MNPRLLVLLLLTVFLSVPAWATDQVVTDPGDNGGTNQLRAKLTALQNAGGGKLTFNTGAATIVLQQGTLPTIATNSTIDGGGNITISGSNTFRILYINGTGALTLRNLTVSNGYSSGGDGGAIFNSGTLNVTSCKFFNNQTSASWSGGAIITYGPLNITNSEFGGNKGGGGGAVYPRWANSVTTITDCNFHDNEAIHPSGSGYGGALLLWDGTDVTISNSTFTNNIATVDGGGSGGAIFVTANSKLLLNKNSVLTGNSAYASGAIRNDGTTELTNVTLTGNHSFYHGGGIQNGGTLFLTNVSLTGNYSSVWDGGGIYNSGTTTLTDVTLDGNRSGGASPSVGGGGMFNSGNATLSSVTLSNNLCHASGGGIYNSGTATLTNVTVSTNMGSSGDTSQRYFGGGIYNIGNASLTNVTLVGNLAPNGPGAIYQKGGTFTINNTIVAKGASPAYNSNVSLFGNFNLSDDNTCGFGGDRDNVTDLLLGPLADNDGFTKTHLPQAGSRAIDHGTGLDAPPLDQRGVMRPQAAAFDVGSVEAVVPRVENGHPYVQYDGWRGFKNPSANGGYYRMSNIANDTVTYKFTGASIKWITRKAPNMGKALVTIDGVTRGTYDLYSSSVLWKQQIFFAGLTNAAHTLVIKVTGSKNASATDFNVALDGFLVGNSTTAVQESALNVQYNNWVGVKKSAASGGSYRSNGTLGAVTRFRFNGNSIIFITARGPSYGKVNVLIDGVLKSSNLDLYAASPQWQYGVQYSGLANANHTIEIRPAHTKNGSSSGYGVVVDAFTGWFTALP